MKNFRIWIIVCVGMLAFGNQSLWSQQVSDQPPQEQAQQAVPPVDPQPVQIAAKPATVTPAPKAPANPPALVKAGADGVFSSLVHNGDIVDFLKILSVASHKNIIPSKQVRGNISVNLHDVTYKEALDAVLEANGFAYEEKGPFIYVYTAKELAAKKAAERKMVSKVFTLNYIPASDAEKLVDPLKSEKGTITTSPAPDKTDTASGENWAGSNCLIVYDYPEKIKLIGDTLKKIDHQPAQVLIEATILVAKLDDTNQMGIDFNVLGGVKFNVDASTGAKVGVLPDSSAGTNGAGETKLTGNIGAGGLTIGITNNNVGAFIRALESVTDVVSLGNPKVLTLNKQQGEVRVGGEEGYLTTTTSATTTTQDVKMLETGTILRFRPFIMKDGYIRMELHPEDSTGNVILKGSNALPVKTTTQVTTNVLVKDGRTIVIGGLFREQTSLGRKQVPALGNIPVLGTLFRSTSNKNNREEVIFLITPRIVKEATDYAAADEVMENCNKILLGARRGMSPLARESIANALYQRARQSQEAGNVKKALWYARLANYTSPLFLDAIKLRDELEARRIYTGQYGSMRNFMRRLLERDRQDNIVSSNDPYGTYGTRDIYGINTGLNNTENTIGVAFPVAQKENINSQVNLANKTVTKKIVDITNPKGASDKAAGNTKKTVINKNNVTDKKKVDTTKAKTNSKSAVDTKKTTNTTNPTEAKKATDVKNATDNAAVTKAKSDTDKANSTNKDDGLQNSGASMLSDGGGDVTDGGENVYDWPKKTTEDDVDNDVDSVDP